MAKSGVVALCAITLLLSCVMLSLATDYTVGWASGVDYTKKLNSMDMLIRKGMDISITGKLFGSLFLQ